MSDEGQTPEQETPQAAEGQQEGQAEQAEPSIHEQINDRFDQLSNTMQQWMASQQQPEYDGWEDPGNQYDDFGQQGFDPNQQQEIDPAIAPYVQQTQALQQVLGQMQEGMYQRDIQELQDEYPDLRTDQQVVAHTIGLARQMTQQARPSRMALEIAYKALQADKYAEQQASQQEAQPQVAVEGAGAEAPVPEPNMADQLFGQDTGPTHPIFGVPMKR